MNPQFTKKVIVLLRIQKKILITSPEQEYLRLVSHVHIEGKLFYHCDVK